jgi:hypothetical protein
MGETRDPVLSCRSVRRRRRLSRCSTDARTCWVVPQASPGAPVALRTCPLPPHGGRSGTELDTSAGPQRCQGAFRDRGDGTRGPYKACRASLPPFLGGLIGRSRHFGCVSDGHALHRAADVGCCRVDFPRPLCSFVEIVPHGPAPRGHPGGREAWSGQDARDPAVRAAPPRTWTTGSGSDAGPPGRSGTKRTRRMRPWRTCALPMA